jgi:phage N-6-adenine-methyltransferase
MLETMGETEASGPVLNGDGKPDLDELRTPVDLWECLNKRYRFVVDLAASDQYHLCPTYFTKAKSGLEHRHLWPKDGRWCWLNPPYSRGNLYRWIEAVAQEANIGAHVVTLVPAYTADSWFSEFVFDGADAVGSHTIYRGPNAGKVLRLDGGGGKRELNFLSKRLKFWLPFVETTSANYASVLIEWGPASRHWF